MAQYGPPSIADTINDFTKSVGGNINTLQGQSKLGGLPRTPEGDIDWRSAAGMAFVAAHPEMAKGLVDAGTVGDQQALLRTQTKRAALIPVSDETSLYDVNQGGFRTGGVVDTAGVPPEIVQMGPAAVKRYKQVMADRAASQNQPRDFTYTDIGKLKDEGGNYVEAVNLDNSFKGSYANLPGVQGVQNWFARNAPESMTSPEQREAASWWQRYNIRKNLVRNNLFGAALSKGEQAAFDKADITEGMNEATIRANLGIQRQILENAVGRHAASLAKDKFRLEPIAAAYGITPQRLQQMMVSSVPDLAAGAPAVAGGGAAPSAPAQAGAAPQAAPAARQPPKVGTIAEDASGKKLVWNGSGWVPTGGQPSADTSSSMGGAP